MEQPQSQNWNPSFNSPGARIVIEVAAAYAITKALLPVRLILSVWATPWFARVVIGRVWKGALGLGRAGRGAGTTAVEGVQTAGTGTMGKAAKAAKEVGKDMPKT
jgi:hypothetical protein